MKVVDYTTNFIQLMYNISSPYRSMRLFHPSFDRLVILLALNIEILGSRNFTIDYLLLLARSKTSSRTTRTTLLAPTGKTAVDEGRNRLPPVMIMHL